MEYQPSPLQKAKYSITLQLLYLESLLIFFLQNYSFKFILHSLKKKLIHIFQSFNFLALLHNHYESKSSFGLGQFPN